MTRPLIISIPKAGTYLLAEILKLWGFSDFGVHLGLLEVTDYRGLSLEEQRINYLKYTNRARASVVALSIPDNHYSVGHLPYYEEIIQSFSKFRKIFISRNLRESLISHMRFSLIRSDPSFLGWQNPDPRKQFIAYLGSPAARAFLQLSLPMGGWTKSDAFKIRFE